MGKIVVNKARAWWTLWACGQTDVMCSRKVFMTVCYQSSSSEYFIFLPSTDARSFSTTCCRSCGSSMSEVKAASKRWFADTAYSPRHFVLRQCSANTGGIKTTNAWVQVNRPSKQEKEAEMNCHHFHLYISVRLNAAVCSVAFSSSTTLVTVNCRQKTVQSRGQCITHKPNAHHKDHVWLKCAAVAGSVLAGLVDTEFSWQSARVWLVTASRHSVCVKSTFRPTFTLPDLVLPSLPLYTCYL